MNDKQNNVGWHDKVTDLQPDIRPLINGERIKPESGEFISRCNPANGEEGISIYNCNSIDIDNAVEAGTKVFQDGTWSQIPPVQCKHILSSFADLLLQHQEELALLDSLEMGKPVSMALTEVQIANSFISYYGECIDKIYGKTAPSASGTLEIQTRKPRGVVAAIVPWNFPVVNTALKIAPALAAGNSVILKPSEYSVLSALRLGDLAMEAGLPPGTLNIVTGGGDTGTSLANHKDIDMVTFTGSTLTGQRIMQGIGGSEAIKPIMLECGGKNPQLIFEDFISDDIQGLAQGIVQAAMMNQGQVCVARSRVLVDKKVHDKVLDSIVEACQMLKPDDPLLSQTMFGPMANKMQYEKVLNIMESNEARKLELVLDGRAGELPEKGFYISPSVYNNVDPTNTLFHEEIFGPVLTVTPFTSEEEAVQLANNTRYGLAATIWTKGLARGHRVSQNINAGWIAVNANAKPSFGAGIAHSHEPYGQSGFGVEGGTAGLESYTRVQATTITYG